MKIESGPPGNFIFGESGDIGTGTEITREDGTVTIAPGEQDLLNISQIQNSLQITINGSQTILLNPEESRNLEIIGNKGQVTIDPNVSIPVQGLENTITSPNDMNRISTGLAASRQNEASFAASVTQRILISELGIQMSESFRTHDESYPLMKGEVRAELQTELSQETIHPPPNLPLYKEEEQLSSEQKGDLIQELSERTVVNNNPVEIDANRASLNRLMQSMTSPEEFRDVVTSTSIATLQQSMLQGVSDPRSDRLVADFNITAGAMNLRQLAIDPSQFTIGANALALGLSPHQIVSARQELASFMDPVRGFLEQDAIRLSENPIVMSLTTPEEKGRMLSSIVGGKREPLSPVEGQSVLSILEFANNPGEFNFLMKASGMENLPVILTEEDALRFNHIAAAYGRSDLITVADPALPTLDVLTDSGRVSALLHSIAAVNLNDTDVTSMISSIFTSIQTQITSLDRRSVVRTVLENAIRESTGLPLLDPRNLRLDAQSMLRETPPGLWGTNLKRICDAAGISEDMFREIVTQPLVQIFRGAASELADRIGASAGQAKMLGDVTNRLVDALPARPESFQKLFATILPSAVLPAPVTKELRLGNLPQILDRLASFPAPALARLAVSTKQVISLPDFLPIMANSFGRLKTSPFAGEFPLPLRAFIDRGISFAQNVQNGIHAETLASIAESSRGPEDSKLRRVKELATNGAAFFSDLASGKFRETLATFTRELRNFVMDPSVARINQLALERAEIPADETESYIREPFESLRDAANDFLASPAFHRALETVRMSGDFLGALYRGNFVQILAPLNSRLGNSPAVLHVIQSGLHLTTLAGSFIRSVVQRDYERPIQQALKKNPSGKGLKEAEEVFSQTAQVFVPVVNVELMDAIWQYQKQMEYLRDNLLIDRAVQALKTNGR